MCGEWACAYPSAYVHVCISVCVYISVFVCMCICMYMYVRMCISTHRFQFTMVALIYFTSAVTHGVVQQSGTLVCPSRTYVCVNVCGCMAYVYDMCMLVCVHIEVRIRAYVGCVCNV